MTPKIHKKEKQIKSNQIKNKALFNPIRESFLRNETQGERHSTVYMHEDDSTPLHISQEKKTISKKKKRQTDKQSNSQGERERGEN